jgi:methionyl-tRNA formyltransferase
MDRNSSIVYLGTENNSKSCLGLEDILEDGWHVRLVIAYEPSTQENRRRSFLGRIECSLAKVIRLCPPIERLIRRILRRRRIPIEFKSMKELSGLHNVPYEAISDRSLQTLKDRIAHISPDVILSNGWMFKVTEDIFSLARLIALNCHSSYLPEYRGGNVTYAPLINAENRSGVTVHQLVERFDAGPILAQRRVSIDPGEIPQSLNAKRAQITGQVIIEAFKIAGHEELYKPNPPSPFYFRCDYATYERYKLINFLRKLIGAPIKRYEPRERYDI